MIRDPQGSLLRIGSSKRAALFFYVHGGVGFALGAAMIVAGGLGLARADWKDALLGYGVILTAFWEVSFIFICRAGIRWKESGAYLRQLCADLGAIAQRACQSEKDVRYMSLELARIMDERMARELQLLEKRWEAEWEERKIEIYELAYKAALDQQKIGALDWEDIETQLREMNSVGEEGDAD